MNPEKWKVGIVLEDGSCEILTESTSTTPSGVQEVFFPLSLPWIDEPVLYDVPLQQVEVRERNMGPEKHYSAKVEDTVPNSDDIWEVELELWEYPPGSFNTSELTHTDHVRVGEWSDEDLLDAVRND